MQRGEDGGSNGVLYFIFPTTKKTKKIHCHNVQYTNKIKIFTTKHKIRKNH